jgi:hypothetical protein
MLEHAILVRLSVDAPDCNTVVQPVPRNGFLSPISLNTAPHFGHLITCDARRTQLVRLYLVHTRDRAEEKWKLGFPVKRGVTPPALLPSAPASRSSDERADAGTPLTAGSACAHRIVDTAYYGQVFGFLYVIDSRAHMAKPL